MNGEPRSPRRRGLLLAGTLAAGLPAAAAALAGGARVAGGAGGRRKVLRYAFPVAETGFDPVQISDLYSRIVTAHIFESPLRYDYLARPYKLRPGTAAAMPEVSADHRVFTVRIQPGIFFADDPAFGGRRRELIAADYVYQYKRFFDPRWKAPALASWQLARIVGMNEYRDEVLAARQTFDYDRAIAGLQVLDRYTFQVRLAEPDPRFLYTFAANDIAGAVAREVVERYGEKIMEHPVGTGPFRLAEWRRSSSIALDANPEYRDVRYDEEPNGDDAEGQAIARRFRGRRIPFVDRVEVSIIEESQPRYLAFANDEHDVLYNVPLDFANLVAPEGRIAPHLQRRGVGLHRALASDITMTIYNMEHPVIGGYTPDKVALRRAINLATNLEKEIRLVRRKQAIVAQSPFMPFTYGYDPAFRSEMGEYDLPRAKALLDLYGYVDRNGDGWREQPDGSPLRLEFATLPDQLYRQFDEVWKKDMEALGIQVVFQPAQWPENLKRARAGKFMLWSVGLSAASPDGQPSLQRGYGPAVGGQNLARFKLEAFDRLYERMKVLPDGPERLDLFLRATKLLTAYAPYKFHVHRVLTDLTQPWVSGFRRPPFSNNWWQYVDVDPEGRRAAGV